MPDRDERRYRHVRVLAEHVAEWLFSAERDAAVLCRPGGIPRDVRVVRMFPDQLADSFVLVLEHPSFDPVPAGQCPPDCGILELELIRYRRLANDPQLIGYYTVTVPSED